MTLSRQDVHDLNKYTKFLALKATLLIVQSRQGEKISTSCKPPNPTGSDWFYISVGTDLTNVVAETKRLFEADTAKISKHVPLCVEISLRTSDGETMVLEYWCLTMEHDTHDSEVKNINLLYARMGILLRSLISVTRVTPAYKYSRKQGAENQYVICYRIFLDKPDLNNLGEGYKQTRIGQICTPVSKINLSVAYRMKMSLSPTQAGKNSDIMVKSDYFNANTNNTRKDKNNSEEDINDLTKPMKQGAFAEPKEIKSPEPQSPDVTRLLAMGKKPRRSTTSESETESSCCTSFEDAKKEKVVAEDPPCVTTSPSMTSAQCKQTDDFWLKDLEAPFALRSDLGELVNFYRDCKKSPPLGSFQKNPSPAEISEMIEKFESRVPEYDALVQSFCETPEDI